MGKAHPYGSGGLPIEEYDLIFETPPEPPLRKRRKNGKWEKLLVRPKAAPGSPMRIRTYPSRAAAQQEVVRIKQRLRLVAPQEHWEFQTGIMPDSATVFGAWVTYRGMYTSEEYRELVADREKRHKSAMIGAEKAKKTREINKIKANMDKGRVMRPGERPW